MNLKQFRSDGCLSYLLIDSKSREAALIDPTLEMMDDYRSFIADHKLTLKFALDTHTHADHFSATQEIRTQYKVDIGMSELTGSARVTRRFKSGEKMTIGSISLEVMATPGHTPDSVSYYAVEGALRLVFTGDTLFVGGSGRTDFPGSDPAQQWKSIHEILGGLPDSTVVLPGHDYNDFLFTTIGVEKKKNAHWLIPSQEKFVAMKNQEGISTSREEIKKRIAFNLSSDAATSAQTQNVGAATSCGTVSKDLGSLAAISVQKYQLKFDEKSNTSFIDVREEEEFQDEHIPRTKNIPLSEVALHLDELTKSARVYVSCLAGPRSAKAVKTLNYIGLPDVVNVTGGFKAWEQAGFETIKPK